MTENTDPPAVFDPDEALERMRELAGSEDNANETVSPFRRLRITCAAAAARFRRTGSPIQVSAPSGS